MAVAVVAAACSSAGSTRTVVPPDPPAGAKSASQPVAPDPIVVHVVGDWLPTSGPLTDQAGYGRVTQPLVDRFGDDDLTIANLECAVAPDAAPRPGLEFAFPCLPEDLDELVRSGVDAVTLANDHITDFGLAGIDSTKAALDRAGIIAVGPDTDEAVVIETTNGPVAVLAIPRSGPLPLSEDDAVRAVRDAAALELPLVVSVHWGEAGSRAASPADNELADRLVASGADVVMGHGAGRLHAMRRIDGAVAFMNLGRFVWPVREAPPAEADTAVGALLLVDDVVEQPCLLAATISPKGSPAFDQRDPACQ
ncbi:MAG: CapA family protein [Acidimicrobiia bacterium]|nr:CapA family protein [Acidimicrobiia bacterium]